MADPNAARAGSALARDVFVARQPILDRRQRLYGYEFLFRGGNTDRALVEDDTAATAAVIEHIFLHVGVADALGPYKGFFNVDERLLESDVLHLLPRDKIVLEVLETVELSPSVLERLRGLRAEGFVVALDDVTDAGLPGREAIEQFDIVKVDALALPEPRLEAVTRALVPLGRTLLAEKVDSREQANRCNRLGYALFQGYYFARPALITRRKLGTSEAAVLKLLALLLEDAETAALERELRREPGLMLNLVRLSNSAAMGVPRRVESLRDAILVLGRRQLGRWLQLLLYTMSDGTAGINSPLLQMAAARGRFMELLVARTSRADASLEGRAFLAGILSLMPVLLEISMEQLVESLPVTEELLDALLARTGVLGTALALAETVESGDALRCDALLPSLPGLSVDTVVDCLAQALAWSGSVASAGA